MTNQNVCMWIRYTVQVTGKRIWGGGGQYSDTRYVTILDMENLQVPQTVTQLPQIPLEGNF
jgi:hypothetical protein